MIGFFNHYSELISEATFSSGASSATIGQQTNGGEVNIYGLELAAGYDHPLNETLTLSLQGTYTLTISEFLDTFVSSDPVLGVVLEGERLPNVPRHQGSLTLGISGKVEAIKGGWSLFGTAAYVGKVFETTARRNVPASETINDYTVVDVAASLTFFEHHQLYFKVDNVLDETYLVSRRPFGARPGKPRVYTFGYKFDW